MIRSGLMAIAIASAFSFGALAQTPTVTVTNTTRNSPNFYVGDRFLVTVNGAPNQLVTAQSYQNGTKLAFATYSNTNASGVWQTSGTMNSPNVGTWIEYWWVGGVAARSVSFSVGTSGAASPTKDYIYLNGKVVAIEQK